MSLMRRSVICIVSLWEKLAGSYVKKKPGMEEKKNKAVEQTAESFLESWRQKQENITTCQRCRVQRKLKKKKGKGIQTKTKGRRWQRSYSFCHFIKCLGISNIYMWICICFLDSCLNVDVYKPKIYIFLGKAQFIHTPFVLACFMSSICHLTSHSRWGGTHKDILPKCVCLCVRADALQCLKHHTDLSIWSPPSAIKTGIVYTGGRSLFLPLSLCHSQFVSPPHLFYTQTACTDVPLSQNKECPLQRHLSARGVSGIIHSAVTDDVRSKVNLGFSVMSNPPGPFCATLFSPLILHHQSKNSPPMGLTSSFPWPFGLFITFYYQNQNTWYRIQNTLSTFFQHFLVIFLEFHQLVQL